MWRVYVCELYIRQYVTGLLIQMGPINMKARLFVITLAAALAVAACSGQNHSDKDMNTLSFNERQAAAMTAMACHEARGDQSSLAIAIGEGFEAGLSANQMKEALSQLYAYTGFPRSLNALGSLKKVMEQRGDVTMGPEASPLPAGYDALKQGTEVQTRLSGQPFNYDFCPAEDYYLKAHLFGDIFARDNLTYADRELITVSALSGLENVMPQLQTHVRGALNMGVTEEQLRAIPVALKASSLQAEALRAEAAIAAVVDGKTDVVCAQSPWPVGEPNTSFAQYFSGNSYLAVMDGGMANVTFEPGCRNNWHIHHGAVQVLVCVSGRGWFQEWGKPAVALVPGVIIAIPEGVKHWHGAAADSWMQHLTYHTDVKPGHSNEWLEPVTDEQYSIL